ncbi:MAG: response regulator transcription factor [Saprospiraceae bacterium]|nr:response regulator transcription factor [Candidatus Opimibacter skivensis]MBP6679775.1 response regulator transcription factor [Saprospiraceae bacterium]
MKTYKAVIIEDEERSTIVLQNLLETYCPDVEVVGNATSVQDGIKTVNALQPDILFLDVQIVGGTGFDILEKLNNTKVSIIFTTAYDHYALKAFKFSAIDYLLKPIDIDELKIAVKKVTAPNQQAEDEFKIKNLLSNIKNPSEDPVLLVSTLEAVEFVRIREIIRCEAQGAYTQLILKDTKSVMVSKVIKEFEFLLQEYGFYRVHQSHLINLREVRKYIKSENYLLMRDGAQIQLARSRKDDFFNVLHKVQL